MIGLVPLRRLVWRLFFSAVALLLIGGALFFMTGSHPAEMNSSFAPGPAVVRRLTADQYRNVIHDVFGSSIKLGGYFDPDLRASGLLAVGAGKVAVTPAGMEQYDAIAHTVASQVLDSAHRAEAMPCKPASSSEADDVCARRFLAAAGRLIFRRPLTPQELEAHVGAARLAAGLLKDFYQGLSIGLAAMLSSPQFLFRKAVLEQNPNRVGGFRLDGYSKASQLSFFLWNSGPDLVLLEAAAKGDLDKPDGLGRQVKRMMASPRLEAGVRAFFADMFGFDDLSQLTKDATLFPAFSAQVAADAQEQTLRTLIDLLLKQDGDYRDIFTTRKTFLTQELASIYRVPLPATEPNGAPDTWHPYEFPAADPRSGILTQVSFVALHSPPGRSSPTLRGKGLREIMLCEKVPPPPGDVKFNVINDTSNPLYKTARQRLTAHRTAPSCAGCHKLMDPIGLALENFDGEGAYRTTENGATIDASGELDHIVFKDSAGLGRAIYDNPAAAACLVSRITSYALGRQPERSEGLWVKELKTSFAANGYRLRGLMARVATSPEFYEVAPPAADAFTSLRQPRANLGRAIEVGTR